MKEYSVRVYSADESLPRQKQLAWRLARVASDDPPVDSDVRDTLKNRIIDNEAVSTAAQNRPPVVAARNQALDHPSTPGVPIVGASTEHGVSPEWAAWARGVAVRELDFHDTFLAADYAHPADNIPPVLAVAQQQECNGTDLVRGLLAAYEAHIALTKAICLHEHKIDHIAHLCPAATVGIGSLLDLPTETVYQAIQQAVHVSFQTRQSRKGAISSWKAYAPGFAGKQAIEAIDRAMRGQRSPSPIYEGEDSVIAWMLDGPDATYKVPLPDPDEPRRMILESYTKEHSAEYQAQALIDLAFRMRDEIDDFERIDDIVIHTSHHTHNVIGSGSNDPQKYDPDASRETLDHSIMYIFAVALEDGEWHHEESYSDERSHRPETIELWKKIRTVEDSEWTKRYHHPDPSEKAFGGRVEIQLKNGETMTDEVHVANAHPNSDYSFGHDEYLSKFDQLTNDWILESERDRFLSLVNQVSELSPEQVRSLTLQVSAPQLETSEKSHHGLF